MTYSILLRDLTYDLWTNDGPENAGRGSVLIGAAEGFTGVKPIDNLTASSGTNSLVTTKRRSALCFTISSPFRLA